MFLTGRDQGRAGVTRLRRVSHVEKSIWSGRVGCARTQKNPRAGFVNRITHYSVVDAGRWRTLAIHVDAILAAAIDNIRFGKIPIAAKIDGVVELGSPDMVRRNDRAVCSLGRRRRHGNNSVLRALHCIAENVYSGRAIDQDPRGPITCGAIRWVYVDVVSYIVGCDAGRRSITDLNAVLCGNRSGTHTDDGVPDDLDALSGIAIVGAARSNSILVVVPHGII